MLNLDSLSYENVIKALENGDYYASTGPELQEVYIKDKIVHIKCSPVKKSTLQLTQETVIIKLQCPESV